MDNYPIVNSRDEVLFHVKSEQTAKLLIESSYDRYMRHVHVFVECFGGYFIIQKPLKSEKLTSAVFGLVKGSETYKETAVRLLKGIGINAEMEDLEEITKFFSPSPPINGFVTLFTYLFDPENEEIFVDEYKVEAIITMKFRDLMDDINSKKYDKIFVDLFNIYLQLSNKN